MNVNNNRITQAFTAIKEAGKSAIDNLKGLVKPKESGRADNKDSNVKNGGEKPSSLHSLTKSDSSGSKISSAASLGKALSGDTDTIADKILKEADNPNIIKGATIYEQNKILEMVTISPAEMMKKIGTELQQDKKFMAQLLDVNPVAFKDTFGDAAFKAVFKLTDFYKNSKIKDEANDPNILKGTKNDYRNESKGIRPQEDILRMAAKNPAILEDIGTALQQDKEFMTKLFEDNPKKFVEVFGQEAQMNLGDWDLEKVKANDIRDNYAK